MNRLIFAIILLASSLTIGAQKVVDSVLVIRSGVTEIAEGAYAGRNDIREVKFEGRTVVKIGAEAFAWCENLGKIKLPGSLTDIGSRAFAYCSRLYDVTIPKGVRHIGANAFSFCKSLRSVYLPDSLHEIESYAFSECMSLREVTLPGNGRQLGEMIFAGCRDMMMITIDSATPPPFECNSQLFDNEEMFIYRQCRLFVPRGTVRLYRQASGWSLFGVNIREI